MRAIRGSAAAEQSLEAAAGHCSHLPPHGGPCSLALRRSCPHSGPCQAPETGCPHRSLCARRDPDAAWSPGGHHAQSSLSPALTGGGVAGSDLDTAQPGGRVARQTRTHAGAIGPRRPPPVAQRAVPGPGAHRQVTLWGWPRWSQGLWSDALGERGLGHGLGPGSPVCPMGPSTC